MIRLPPSTIVLGRSDIKDYEKRRRTQKRVQHRESVTEQISERIARFAVRSSQDSTVPDLVIQTTVRTRFAQHGRELPKLTSLPHEPPLEKLSFTQSQNATFPSQGDSPSSPPQPADSYDELALTDFSSDEETSITALELAPENPASDSQQPVSPAKYEFYYGGFIESPSQYEENDTLNYDTLNRSSPFVPSDFSTPQQLQLPDLRRPRARVNLPRSPLFVSYNASSSPEHRPTSGLTPRVTSRVANHNSPGIIFARPARRPPRSSTRAFRHQTNSFSFDSSERSSAAYDQERVISDSTNGRERGARDLNLFTDLQGSSLHGSSASSNHTSSDEHDESVSAIEFAVEVGNGRSQFIFSSPKLPLPPPFSTVSRSTSRAGSLPFSTTSEYIANNPQTSPIRSPTSASTGSGVETSPHSPRLDLTGGEQANIERSKSRTTSPYHIVNVAHRVIDICRTRSPFGRQPSPTHHYASSSASATPRQSQSRHSSANLDPLTPLRSSYHVYNDAVSPEVQPQTPAHVPESRHQSRYHPSYTAPVTRAAARRDAVPTHEHGGESGRLQRQRLVPFYTPQRGGRSTSPTGLTQGGFQGLYGGRENGDEEQSWVDGVRFNNAEIRLWGARDAQNNGGSLRETPEPDELRVGRRS